MYTYNSNLRPAEHLSDPEDIAIRIIYDTVKGCAYPDDSAEDWPSDRCAEIETQITALAIGESIAIDGVTVTRTKEKQTTQNQGGKQND